MSLFPLGVHTSIAGGLSKSVERASTLGCGAMQIFGRNPRSWNYSPVSGTEAELFRKKRLEAGIWPVVVHTTYLINLCSPDEDLYDKSIDLFKKELGIASEIGADYLVTHLGSPRDMGSEYALKRIDNALKEAHSGGFGGKTMVLLENTSGSGYGFGSRLSDLGEIIGNAKAAGISIGFCFDTCHAFAAGYAMSGQKQVDELVRTIDSEAGLENLKVMHLNDSKGGFGSNLDRHEHIGQGKIGLEAFRVLLNHRKIRPVPKILETPKDSEEDDPRNLKAVRAIMGLDLA